MTQWEDKSIAATATREKGRKSLAMEEAVLVSPVTGI
jgi:hypothetical protein